MNEINKIFDIEISVFFFNFDNWVIHVGLGNFLRYIVGI